MSTAPNPAHLEADTFLYSVIEHLPHMVFVKHASTLRFAHINDAGEKIIGIPRRDIIGKTDYDLFGPIMADYYTKSDREVLETKQPLFIPEEKIATRNMGVRYLQTRKVAILDEQGNPLYLLGTAEDITERRLKEKKLDLFFYQSLDYLGIAGFDTIIQITNPAFERKLGYKPGSMIGQSYLKYVHPKDIEISMRAVRQLSEGRNLVAFENRFVCADGSYRHINWNVASHRDQELIYAIGRDITEQRSVEEQIVETSEKERERIAHDLHDGLGQTLTGLAFKAKMLELMLNDGDRPSPNLAAEVVRLANESSEQAQQLARGLDPVELQDGLPTALTFLAAATENLFHIRCKAICRDDPGAINKATAKHLYRIAQEAVNNAIKHGRPSEITITLSQESDTLILNIRDNGSASTGHMHKHDGIGQRIMNFRASMIGGEVISEPITSGGHEVTCVINNVHLREKP